MSTLDLDAVDAFARAQHEGQRRRHGAPYVEHPRAVRLFVEDLGAALGVPIDDELLAAALLHDVLEDTDTTDIDLETRFGPVVARRVRLLTKPGAEPGEDKEARSRRYFEALLRDADDEARLLKIADRLHNLSELHFAPDKERAARYLKETRRYLLPLAREASDPYAAAGLEAALTGGVRLAARLQQLDDAGACDEERVPSGLYAILDVTPDSDLDELSRLAFAATEGGAAIVQVRAKGLSDRMALAFVETVLPLARRAGALLVVNDRADLAQVSGSDGVHLGRGDLPPPRVRPHLPPGMLVGASSHSLEQAEATVQAGGVDYVALGPVYPSPTKQGHADVTGTGALAEVARALPLPVCAIGGITSTSRMAEVARAGAQLGAVVSALSAAPDPHLMARRLSITYAAARAAARWSPA